MTPADRLRNRGERGAALVEFTLVAPLVIGALALAMFAAHSYSAKSALERAAQRATHYAAHQCDPRAFDPSGSSCRSTGYHDDAEIAAEAARRVGDVDATSLSCDAPSTLGQLNVCVIRTPTGSATPNQQVRVELRHRFRTPFRGLLNLLPGDQDPMFDLRGQGEAVVE